MGGGRRQSAYPYPRPRRLTPLRTAPPCYAFGCNVRPFRQRHRRNVYSVTTCAPFAPSPLGIHRPLTGLGAVSTVFHFRRQWRQGSRARTQRRPSHNGAIVLIALPALPPHCRPAALPCRYRLPRRLIARPPHCLAVEHHPSASLPAGSNGIAAATAARPFGFGASSNTMRTRTSPPCVNSGALPNACRSPLAAMLSIARMTF